MRAYKLAYAGSSGVGLSPVQIITTGRVKSVTIGATAYVDGAIDYDLGQIQVGIAAVSENGTPTAAPVNFASVCVSSSRAVAAVEHSRDINVTIPCDYPVSAGQDLLLNIVGLSQAGSNWEAVEVLVWVA